MNIIGSGMAGLIVGVLNPSAKIYEASDSLPANHQAVLRFREDTISKLTGIPFKKVKVRKDIWLNHRSVQCSPRLANLYSQKVIGKILDRSIWNLDPVERYIAPPDFHNLLADLCVGRINYGWEIKNKNQLDALIEDDTTISTMPMWVLAGILGIKFESDFTFQEITTSRYKINNCNVHQTVYFPDPEIGLYRATLTGDNLILESNTKMAPIDLMVAREAFGIDLEGFSIISENHRQKYGKISPIDENERKQFITKTTIDHGIYSLGRFATWRNILLDDVVKDVYVIKALAEKGYYEHLIQGN